MGVVAGLKGVLKGSSKKTKPKIRPTTPPKSELEELQGKLGDAMTEKKRNKIKKKISEIKKSDKIKKESLDTVKDSPRKAILQAQQYKKIQSGLEKQYEKTLSAYNKIKDKKSETAMLMRNKLNDMAKKLKGKKSIPMLPEGKAQGGLQMPTANQTGLRKLPTAVRNKMGYMYGGGMSKKPKMSSMDYRKGGMVLIALNLMKKKGKSK